MSMWVARTKCPKCFRTHLFLLRSSEPPQEGKTYTGHCPDFFMPFYIPGGKERLFLFKEEKEVEVPISWEKVEKEPEEPFVEVRPWTPEKVIWT